MTLLDRMTRISAMDLHRAASGPSLYSGSQNVAQDQAVVTMAKCVCWPGQSMHELKIMFSLCIIRTFWQAKSSHAAAEFYDYIWLLQS